jgi:hypothetical protein
VFGDLLQWPGSAEVLDHIVRVHKDALDNGAKHGFRIGKLTLAGDGPIQGAGRRWVGHARWTVEQAKSLVEFWGEVG